MTGRNRFENTLTRFLACCAAAALLTCVSCARAPVAVRPAEIDASGAAASMLEQYDTNASSTLSAEETSACPGLASQFSRYDADGNGEIDRDEIVAQVRQWSADGVGIMRVGCRVTLDGRPLPNAQVELVPQPFLADALKPATGTTSAHGQCSLSVRPEDLPEELQRVRGVQPGLYLVRITHTGFDIPAHYNTQTELGLEVATNAIGPEGVELALKSH